ncbi:MIP/aquaporin family protein [Phenylobacterium sp.]|uniref:MIP/aquaporin family protein n=1 Tax=Phenylobacterium sp. TaxID=1871053 RepID=UPI0011F5ABD7|nr:MIP/aquaporin family protein [Phenylobacterium sp.]THD61151.1 MAG: aquaporin family protein [Phenylobacterium sp.]
MTAPGDASLEPPLEAFSVGRRLTAEALGTALLLAIVIGSGIMGERLAGGNQAIALLGNTLATGAGLVVLITIFGPISGAHFNPAVTLAFALRRELPARLALAYVAAQLTGAMLGVFAAHAMFAEPILQVSAKFRDGPAQAWSEFVATFGLLATILGTLRFRPQATPMAVGLYITAAYWFTASTSFANPAVTLARSFSDTFAGIAPASAPAFIAGQILGALAAVAAFGWLLRGPRGPAASPPT